MSRQLPHDFDLFYDIKTYEELDEEIYSLLTRVADLSDLCTKHNISEKDLPKVWKLTETMKIP